MGEEQIKQLVPNIGPQAKLLQVHSSVYSAQEDHSINEVMIITCTCAVVLPQFQPQLSIPVAKRFSK